MAFNLLYIDPGTGSMLFSVLISLFALGYFAFRGVMIKLRLLFAGKKGEKGKRIPYVLYNEGRQYWTTFKPVVEEFESRKIPLVYYTSAKDDPVFERTWQFVRPEFIGEGNKAYARLNLLEADDRHMVANRIQQHGAPVLYAVQGVPFPAQSVHRRLKAPPVLFPFGVNGLAHPHQPVKASARDFN